MNRPKKCPVCREMIEPKGDGEISAVLPFCSESCRDRDLGGWLENQYRMGSRPMESDDMDAHSDQTEE